MWFFATLPNEPERSIRVRAVGNKEEMKTPIFIKIALATWLIAWFSAMMEWYLSITEVCERYFRGECMEVVDTYVSSPSLYLGAKISFGVGAIALVGMVAYLLAWLITDRVGFVLYFSEQEEESPVEEELGPEERLENIQTIIFLSGGLVIFIAGLWLTWMKITIFILALWVWWWWGWLKQYLS